MIVKTERDIAPHVCEIETGLNTCPWRQTPAQAYSESHREAVVGLTFDISGVGIIRLGWYGRFV